MFNKFISLADSILFAAFWVLLGTFSNFLTSGKNRTVKSFFVSLFISAPVSILIVLVAMEHGYGDSTSAAAGVCFAIFFEKLINVLSSKEFSSKYSEYADIAIKGLIEKFLGKK